MNTVKQIHTILEGCQGRNIAPNNQEFWKNAGIYAETLESYVSNVKLAIRRKDKRMLTGVFFGLQNYLAGIIFPR